MSLLKPIFLPSGHAIVKRKSPMTNEWSSMTLEITAEQYERWAKGDFAQNAFPNLNADEREFIMTGMTADDWERLFGNGSG